MILMMLLTIVAVGLMALASSQNRIAMNSVLIAEARQTALLGLDTAIAELQMELGPDQRISANSGILQNSDSSGAQYILGSWNSWDGPIYGKSVKGRATSISSTYTKGREAMFRRWLISSKNPTNTRNMGNADQLTTRKPGQRICLIGEGTLGNRASRNQYVYADLISIPSEGRATNNFAWWVGGENQKAKINIAKREDTKDTAEILSRTWDTPRANFSDIDELSFLPDTIDRPERLLTLNTLPLLASGSQDSGIPYFFIATTHSSSLLTNVRTGGLKQDLSLLLNKESLNGTEFARRSRQDCPFAEQGNEIPTCSESEMPIGSWQVLHAYQNAWPNGSERDENFTTRLIGNLDNAYTRMSGSGYKGGSSSNPGTEMTDLNKEAIGDTISVYDTKTQFEQGRSNGAGYARTPVMLAFMNNFGLVTICTSENQEKPTDSRYTLRLCFAPMVLWWNPYNVPMKIRGKQLWSHAVPYRTTWIHTFSNTSGYDGDTSGYRWSHYAMQDAGTSSAGFGKDHGEFFQKSLDSGTQDIVFEPGEILFFSPGKARTKDDYTTKYGNPWVVGYEPSNISGYQAHFYSNKTQAHVADGKWFVSLKLGLNGVDAKNENTDGYDHVSTTERHPECMTIWGGYASINESSTEQPDSGKHGSWPQRFYLGWYDVNNGGLDTVFCPQVAWSTDGAQTDDALPYFVASVGITAKSSNNNLGMSFAPGDYRSKIWQHSSPAFSGSMIVNPDEQQRAYHPYQLSSVPVSGGFQSSPMENIGNNGMLGITSDGEQVSFASVLELPMHPPYSLAGFAGMRLQPGWFEQKGGMYIKLRRMQYQAGVPGVGIGNAFADPTLPADDIYTFHQTNIPPYGEGSDSRIFSEFYDHGLIANDALWDRFFCSSISDRPTNSGTKEARETLTNFLDGSDPLPVARYRKTISPSQDSEIISKLMAEDGWKYVAQYLVIDGGFNINSTSIDAWTAVLQGLAERKLLTNLNTRLSEVESGKSATDVLFSRFMVSTSDKSVDALGGYSMMQGSTSLRKGGMASAWGEVRKLSSNGISELAEEIVKQVRKRGPFLNMSDFINRRLSSDEETALVGALQAAIDETSINDNFKELEIKSNTGSLYKFSRAAQGPIHTAAPGYLIQSDVLMSLGNILTLRDDTFTVRAYGCVKNANNSILAQAWCEAIVQRCVEYVDPINTPDEAEYNADGSKGTNFSTVNKLMGRKMRVISFKWLDHWDI